MRYFLQAAVMIGDLMVWAAIAILLYNGWRSPIVWIIIFLAYKVWRDTGSFEAWHPKVVRQFLDNAKKLGL